MTSSFPYPELNMSVDIVEIDCPNCGKMIHSNDEKCPFCCSHLKFYDFNDLELVANGKSPAEKECRPKEEPIRSEAEEHSENKGFFGKLFGRKKK
jgi:endogenous inhibitor of DNA gyrase (YacG/DUF329 family)